MAGPKCIWLKDEKHNYEIDFLLSRGAKIVPIEVKSMVRMFGCPRSRNAHIERKKSKCDYILAESPSDEQVATIEAKVNEVIAAALPR